MLRIRLRRMGSRHRPFYRVVVSDSRRAPTARALEEIGYYDPRKKPATLSIDVDRVDHWMSHGAKPSSTVRKLVSKARSGAVEAPAAPQAEKKPAKAKDQAAEPEVEVKADAEAETKTKADAEPEAETKADAEPEAAKAEAKADAEAEADAEPEAEDTGEGKAAKSEADAEPEKT